MASIAYSTWKSLPSGEKVFTPLRAVRRVDEQHHVLPPHACKAAHLSYSERVRNILEDLQEQFKICCVDLTWDASNSETWFRNSSRFAVRSKVTEPAGCKKMASSLARFGRVLSANAWKVGLTYF